MAYKRAKTVHPPYTIVGSSSPAEPSVSFTLTAGGLRALLANCETDDDLVHIKAFCEVTWDFTQTPPQPQKRHFSHFSISHHEFESH